jgi:hypothetical protein
MSLTQKSTHRAHNWYKATGNQKVTPGHSSEGLLTGHQAILTSSAQSLYTAREVRKGGWHDPLGAIEERLVLLRRTNLRKLTAILILAVITVASVAAWQIGACFLANRQMNDNMQDMASQAGVLVGLTSPRSDEDFRSDILHHAQEHGISLTRSR